MSTIPYSLIDAEFRPLAGVETQDDQAHSIYFVEGLTQEAMITLTTEWMKRLMRIGFRVEDAEPPKADLVHLTPNVLLVWIKDQYGRDVAAIQGREMRYDEGTEYELQLTNYIGTPMSVHGVPARTPQAPIPPQQTPAAVAPEKAKMWPWVAVGAAVVALGGVVIAIGGAVLFLRTPKKRRRRR